MQRYGGKHEVMWRLWKCLVIKMLLDRNYHQGIVCHWISILQNDIDFCFLGPSWLSCFNFLWYANEISAYTHVSSIRLWLVSLEEERPLHIAWEESMGSRGEKKKEDYYLCNRLLPLLNSIHSPFHSSSVFVNITNEIKPPSNN